MMTKPIGKIKINKKTIIVISLVGGSVVFFIVALIVSLIWYYKQDVSLGFSIASSVISILLSGVAIIYSYFSGVKLDKQLDRLMELITRLQKEQSKIDEKMGELSQLDDKDLSEPLKKALADFRKSVKVDISSIYEDI